MDHFLHLHAKNPTIPYFPYRPKNITRNNSLQNQPTAKEKRQPPSFKQTTNDLGKHPETPLLQEDDTTHDASAILVHTIAHVWDHTTKDSL